MDKDHVVYRLSENRLARFRELFLTPEYKAESSPSYQADVASNPLKVFSAIPPDSRYRFLLDDARFFIVGFIKGPVCRGQVALNVIEDHFWVFLFNPGKPIISEDAGFLDTMADNLQMPNEQGSNLKLWNIWSKYWKLQKNYMQARQAYWLGAGKTLTLDKAMDYIWAGEGNNQNSALTIYRHFDSASVEAGLSGDYPETAWVIDYPLFERIHYLLVSGFNVYGNLGHQLDTRLYMDFLRMEGENQFLIFLPAHQRRAIHDSWYVGVRSDMQKELDAPQAWLDSESVTDYHSNDPQRELYQQLEAHINRGEKIQDSLNRCQTAPCLDITANSDEQRADNAMRTIAGINGEILRIFPDLAFVRVRTSDNNEADLAYTLIRNKAYTNISAIFENEDRRDREFDTLTVKKGLVGSYPNFFFNVDLSEIELFAEHHTTIAKSQRL